MAENFQELDKKHAEFINKQHLFFIGTAGAEGTVNVSPKGMDSLKVINPSKVVWLNYTGSGNETSTHVQENGRMTIMFCSFEKQPLILKLYGEAEVVHPRDSKWDEYNKLFGSPPGARQYFDLNIDLVLSSCGYAVPFYDYKGERETLLNWTRKKGHEGIVEYWKEKNQVSLDGKNTYIVEKS
ncbi:MAG: pyridoxamine 5'-phosphate oxidase family protein [bacterium]|nr:pyridoxamine 5'-phosphate oxidase family protein [bacterium]